MDDSDYQPKLKAGDKVGELILKKFLRVDNDEEVWEIQHTKTHAVQVARIGIHTKRTALEPEMQLGKHTLKQFHSIKDGKEIWLTEVAGENKPRMIAIDVGEHNKEYLEKYFGRSGKLETIEVFEEHLFQPQEIVDGWQLQQHLGRGTCCDVWHATRLDDSQEAALKIFISAREDNFALFTNEIKIAKHLSGSQLAAEYIDSHINEHFNPQEKQWLAIERVDPIIDELRASGKLDELINAIKQFARLIDKLSSLGVYYDDIKLDHLAKKQEKYCLIDFGTAILKPNQAEAKEHITRILKKLIYFTEEFVSNQKYPHQHFSNWLATIKPISSLEELIKQLEQWQEQSKKQNKP